MSMVKKIAIVDDHVLVSKAFKTLLESREGYNILFEARDISEMMNKLNWAEKPDVILMDYSLKNKEDGEEAIKLIRKELGDDIGILALSMHTEEGIIYKMIKAGANGYLPKDCEQNEIFIAIDSIFENGIFLSKYYSKAILNRIRNSDNQIVCAENGFLSLNQTDIGIIIKICEEKSNEIIAEEMNLSFNTINTYRKRILKKTNSSNTAGLVVFAIKNGIYDL